MARPTLPRELSARLAEQVRTAAAARRPLAIAAGGTKAFYGNPTAGDRQGDAVAILTGPNDIVGRIVVLDFKVLCVIQQIENAIEADGGTPQGRKVESPHSHILRVSNMVTSRHVGYPPTPAPDPCRASGRKNLGTGFFDFKRSARVMIKKIQN